MGKSETDESISHNIGVPALRGLVYDAEEQMFYVVNTCPGAGSCAVVCYARRGNYVILPNVFIKQTRVLNLLLNNPDLFKKLLYGELERVCLVNNKKKLIFRWDDAGDFFSKKYYEIALEITKGLKSAGYNFESYGYTKMGDIYNLADPNMLLSFSTDGNRTEKGKVDLDNAKTAEIVPKDLFRDLFVMNKGNFAVENEKLIPVSADSINTLKQRIADKFGVDIKSLLTYDEMIRTKPQEGVIWNVITMPKGDGDVTAQRRDIKRSFLLIH